LHGTTATPISNLAIIDWLNLLRALFREILIPGAVQAELDQLSHAAALKESFNRQRGKDVKAL
jgi:predicted nucleic acid-binding protein